MNQYWDFVFCLKRTQTSKDNLVTSTLKTVLSLCIVSVRSHKRGKWINRILCFTPQLMKSPLRRTQLPQRVWIKSIWNNSSWESDWLLHLRVNMLSKVLCGGTSLTHNKLSRIWFIYHFWCVMWSLIGRQMEARRYAEGGPSPQWQQCDTHQ